MKKRILALMMLLVLMMGMSPTVFAADIASGTCGDNMTWRLSDNGVLTISGSGAMYDYTIPNKGPWYSHRNSISSVVIGEGITDLGNCAFYMCSNITQVSFPSTLKSLGERCFDFCTRLNNVTLPAGLTEIADHAFSDCDAFTSIVVPEGVTRLGTHCFSGCANVTSVRLPGTLKTIGMGAFYSCLNLPAVTIPAGVTVIEDYAFYTCRALGSVFIPGSVTGIGQEAFYNCSALTIVTLEDGVQTIGSMAFYGCTELSRVDIPDSVNSISYDAFYNCTTSKLTIYGNSRSYAETFAHENSINFVAPHNYDGGTVIAPTCTETGFTIYTCLDCGDTYMADGTDPLGHDYVNAVCTRCGDVIHADVGMAGDMDDNGIFNVRDIILLKNLILGGQWSAEELARGDLNGNHVLEVADIFMMKQLILEQ